MDILYCPKCQRRNSGKGNYCGHCGYFITEMANPDNEVKIIRNDLEQAKTKITGIERRLTALERASVTESHRSPIQSTLSPEESNESLPEVQTAKPIVIDHSQGHQSPPQAKAQHLAQPSPISSPPQKSNHNLAWEQALPGNWMARIGIIALFIGLGFLVKLAFDNDWLGAIGQLLLGIFVGSLLIIGGEYWNKQYHVWAQTLTGGGIAVLYLSLFASYALHDLLGMITTFTLMFLVTAGAIGLALRQNSIAVAILGITGAFVTPIILGIVNESSDNLNFLLPYTLLLDSGIVALSSFRNWRGFNFLGIGGSMVLFGVWYFQSGDSPSMLLAEGTLTGIFVIFFAATAIFHVFRRHVPEPTDLILLTINTALYFGISYKLLWDEYHSWIGLFSLLVSALYIALAYLSTRRSSGNERLGLLATGLALLSLTIAIPVQFIGACIPIAWAIEATLLMLLSSRFGLSIFRLFSLGIFIVLLGRLIFVDTILNQEGFRLIFNDMVLSFSISIAALYISAHLLKHNTTSNAMWIVTVMQVIANILTVWLLSAEIINFTGYKINDEVIARSIQNLQNIKNLALGALWALYSFGLTLTGFHKKLQWMRTGGYALIVMTIGLVTIQLNHHQAMIDQAFSTPILNYSFIAFTLCIALLYTAAFLLHKAHDNIGEIEIKACPIVILAANILSLWVLSAELIVFLDSSNATNFSLTVLWIVYSFILIMLGILKQWQLVRLSGYALLIPVVGIVTTQLNHHNAMVSLDHSTIMLNYSFIAFAVCIFSLYLLAYVMYQASDDLDEIETRFIPFVIAAANILSLWVLSAEVMVFMGSDNAKSLSLTMLWASYSFILILLGIIRQWRWVRMGGLLLVSICIFKLFIIDTFTLEQGYRVAAYLTLGAILLAGGFAYQRFADKIRQFFLE